ncbi:GNAT family N-acetyltransferase [Flavobacterium sp. LB3P45]|uniref:GNAT family N-acetyltransferase n=1 Tax=Flavobacterium fructosi TaxID=3230416 RepID=A0ABW6HQ32_9FLAO
MTVENSVIGDIDVIFKLYDEGTAYQKSVAKKHWKGFERSLIEAEIGESRQWKIIVDGEIACVFAITYSDPFIWEEKDKEPSIYIHRIATNPFFRGNGFTKRIVAWAKEFALENEKRFIRMDTGSGNDKLNNYYISCGFTYLGITEYQVTDSLPEHYKGGSSSLFEIAVQ